LEIDPFDAWSIPFGAFDFASGRLIGTLRLVTTELQSEHAQIIHNILKLFADEELSCQALASRPHKRPSIVTDKIEHAIKAFNSAKFIVQELSRIIVHPDFRGTGISRQLMEFGLAQATRLGPKIIIGSYLAEHLPMYARYGYIKLPQSGLDLFDSVGQVATAGVCHTNRIPEPAKTHVDELQCFMKNNAQECTIETDRGAQILYRFSEFRTSCWGRLNRKGRLAMDIRHLIELFEVESAALNTLVRQHALLRPFFSRDFKGTDPDALKQSYLRLLKMTADYVQYTCPAFRAAGEALNGGDQEDRRWAKIFLDYSEGETDEKDGDGHEVWARDDMVALGAPQSLLTAPPHASVRLYGDYFVKEAARHPYAILGAKGVLEHLSILISDDIADGILQSKIPGAKNATRFFRAHGILDIDHVRDGDRNLEQTFRNEQKIRQVFDGVCFTSTAYRWMLQSYLTQDVSTPKSAPRVRDLAMADG
jgi:predicted GNAT family N-acyltransferase